jgi:hypothetical protein
MLFPQKAIGICLLFVISATAYANNDHRYFSCSLTDRMLTTNYPDKSKDSFSKDTSTIYLACASSQIEKGQHVHTAWFAADTNQVAPDNFKISEKEMKIVFETTYGKFTHVNFALSMPEKNWPLGRYYVNLYVDGTLDQRINFNIQ